GAPSSSPGRPGPFPCTASPVVATKRSISLAPFHAYLADLADCANECFPFSWLIFACICSLI
uniref:Uncharacterized protein n=1 Tax=Nothoprocta perdicaria TaxID=30464 RepID=A0A8C6ZF42_NOTPE